MVKPNERARVALTIAGSDSGGGAGIQADLKTFHTWAVFGTTVVTALTAQNTRGVAAVHAVPPSFVAEQLDAVLGDIGADAVKTGMLGGPATVSAVATALRRHRVEAIVCDPVMVAKDGSRLLAPDAEAALRAELLPLAAVVTPNAEEVKALVGIEVTSVAGAREAAEALCALGPRAALVKGGHLGLEPNVALDILYDGSRHHELRQPRIPTHNTHGTGCTLSAAIAAGLALGLGLLEAVTVAKRFLTLALASGFVPGAGGGYGCPDTRVRPPLG
jgi:hydroxymethylpyrimidine/phosphomethylpyrimidine kinase